MPNAYEAELAEGSARAARTIDCHRCGRPVIRGDDHDNVAMVATVDPDPLNPDDEWLEHLNGRPTYSLERQQGKTARRGARDLWYRGLEIVAAGRLPRVGTLHRAHQCTPQETA